MGPPMEVVRLGHYQLLGLIGSGGMGEVYRARDTQLPRDVALKLLSAEFASDAERVARFDREARVLASLNHPNIAHIYGIEREGSTRGPFLVMELVEGSTLADRIAQGPLPLEDALPIALQMVQALEAAHEQGIVHRDLKPANIKVRADGVVKVLDFGLAKAMDAPSAARPTEQLSNSPTITSPALMTGAGVILGTAAYMSPEQARGKVVDKRADIWAFGCVLYEMLTGRRAFGGDDVTDTIVSVVSKEPDWTALPASTPLSIQRLLHRCLEKDPQRRLPDIGVARLEINDGSNIAPIAEVPAAAVRRGRESVAWLVAAVSLVLAAIAGLLFFGREDAEPASAIRLEASAPDSTSFLADVGRRNPISPDGRLIAMVVTGDDGLALVVRSLDTGESRTIMKPDAGTPNLSSVFWSPDSRFIAFVNTAGLWKIEASGGAPQMIAPLPGAGNRFGGTWNADGIILIGVGNRGIVRVDAGRGELPVVTTMDGESGERWHRNPWFLPDGRHFIYVAGPPTKAYVASLDSTVRIPLMPTDSRVEYANGHLLFVREGTLYAQPFDVEAVKTDGEPVRLVDEVSVDSTNAQASFSASTTGVLVYGTLTAPDRLAWFDHSGHEVSEAVPAGNYGGLDVSADGRRIIVSERGNLKRFVDGRPSVFTTDATKRYGGAMWSPDDSQIAYTSAPARGPGHLIVKPSNGGGMEREILELQDKVTAVVTGWSPTGDEILFQQQVTGKGLDIFKVSLSGDPKAVPVLETNSSEGGATITPNGRWMAYHSDEAGRPEVYVRPWPNVLDGKDPITTAGGSQPRWSEDGRELYYRALDTLATMVVPVQERNGQFEVGAPRELVPGVQASRSNPLGMTYDVAEKGTRVLMMVPPSSARNPLKVIVNWPSLLQR